MNPYSASSPLWYRPEPRWRVLADAAIAPLRRSPLSLPLVAAGVFMIVAALEVFDIPGMVRLAVAGAAIVMAVVRVRATGQRLANPSIPSVLMLSTLLLSVLWSDVPLYTAERMRTYGPILASAWLLGAVARHDEFAQIMRWSTRVGLWYSTMLVATSAQARNAVGIDADGWHAQYTKNGFGLMLAYWFLCVLVFEAGLARSLQITVILVLSAGNSSRTAQLAMVVLAALLIGQHWVRGAHGWSQRRTRALQLLWGGVLFGALAFSLRDAALSAVGKDPTLSQRTRIWEAVIPQIEKRPLLGHGAFAFLEWESNSPTRLAVARYFNLFQPPHSHSATLDLMGQIGLIGLIVYLATMWSFASTALRVRDTQLKTFALLLVVFYLVAGLVEPMFLGPWLVILFLADGRVRQVAARYHFEDSQGARKDAYAGADLLQGVSRDRGSDRRGSVPAVDLSRR